MIKMGEIREKKGMTIAEVAKHCGVSEGGMVMFECDPGTMPKFIACKIKKLYGISLDSLYN